MTQTTDLHIRIDPETKIGAEHLCAAAGITITDAVIMFFRQSLLTGELHFELHQPRYNVETEAAIQEAKDIMAGKVNAKIYQSVAEMNADIDANDD